MDYRLILLTIILASQYVAIDGANAKVEVYYDAEDTDSRHMGNIGHFRGHYRGRSRSRDSEMDVFKHSAPPPMPGFVDTPFDEYMGNHHRIRLPPHLESKRKKRSGVEGTPPPAPKSFTITVGEDRKVRRTRIKNPHRVKRRSIKARHASKHKRKYGRTAGSKKRKHKRKRGKRAGSRRPRHYVTYEAKHGFKNHYRGKVIEADYNDDEEGDDGDTD